jgi:hypothetical protein
MICVDGAGGPVCTARTTDFSFSLAAELCVVRSRGRASIRYQYVQPTTGFSHSRLHCY